MNDGEVYNQSISILLIEDNAEDAHLIKRMLRPIDGAQFGVEHLDSLPRGMESLQKNRYDLILLDLSLPDSDGMGTLRWAKKFASQHPIIILTGAHDDRYASESINAGAQDFLTKSELTDISLQRSIRHAIERKHIIEDLQRAEEAAQIRATQYATMISTTPDGFWQFDADAKLLEVNDAYCRMSGYSRNELLNMHIPDLEAKEKPSDVIRHIAKITKNGFDRYESRHRRKDGAVIDVEISVSYCPVDHQFLLFARDNTERKKSASREQARSDLLNNLRTTRKIDECLNFGCQAVVDAGLFERAQFTMHYEHSEVINFGQVGLGRTEIMAIKKTSAPDAELIKKIRQETYKIGQSYFIPKSDAVSVIHTSLFIAPEILMKGNKPSVQIGNALFIPATPDKGNIDGWLSIVIPADQKKPNPDAVIFLEEIVEIVSTRARELYHSQELDEKRQRLEEKTITLREVLSGVEAEKLEVRKQISSAIDHVLKPAFKKLLKKDGTINKTYFELVKNNIEELSEATGSGLAISTKLSPREMEICSMIKNGASSKDIAESLNIALVTVQKHREVIRKKLGLANRNINLTSYLRNL